MANGRPKKRKLELNETSFMGLQQEFYNELVEQRNTCILQINENKKQVDVDDMHDLVSLNKANTDLLKIIDNTMQKKFELIKLVSSMVFKGSSNAKPADENLSPEDLAMLEKMFGKNDNKDNDSDEYKIKD